MVCYGIAHVNVRWHRKKTFFLMIIRYSIKMWNLEAVHRQIMNHRYVLSSLGQPYTISTLFTQPW